MRFQKGLASSALCMAISYNYSGAKFRPCILFYYTMQKGICSHRHSMGGGRRGVKGAVASPKSPDHPLSYPHILFQLHCDQKLIGVA